MTNTATTSTPAMPLPAWCSDWYLDKARAYFTAATAEERRMARYGLESVLADSNMKPESRPGFERLLALVIELD